MLLPNVSGKFCVLQPLFHPRRDNWHEHFRLEEAVIEPLTPTGRVTVRLLQLNQISRVNERKLLIEAGYYPLADKI